MDRRKDIERAQRGDRAAFGRLVERYQDLVFGICCQMTAQRADAEDLAHDALVEAYLKLATLRDLDCFEAWLRTLTLNICRMWHRQRRRVAAEIAAIVVEPVVDGDLESPWGAGAFAELAHAHRLALALYYGEGLSYAEMARLLEVPVGTVMSRLNRARKVLRTTLEKYEEEKMGPGRDLQAEVDAEIEVLLKLFGADAESMQRLSVVLERSPQRFRQVVAQVEDPVGVEQVALLLRHLGRSAIESVVGSYFDADAIIREKALAVLLRLIGHWQDREKPDHGFMLPLLPEVHLLLDVIMTAPQSPTEQVGLLVDLLAKIAGKHITPGATLPIFICVLRGYGDLALTVLHERFMQLQPQRKRTPFDPLVAGLGLFYTPFCQKLSELLQTGDGDRVRLGLRGAEGLAGVLKQSGTEDLTDKEQAYQRRIRGMLFAEQIDIDAFAALVEAVANTCQHADSAMRQWALEVLANLPAEPHVNIIRARLADEDQAVRLAAITTVSMLGDLESVGELMECVRSEDSVVRRRAVEALAHMRAEAARSLMEELIADLDAEVRKAAITSLADIGDEGSREKLTALMQGKDKKTARLAAQALYRRQRTPGREASKLRKTREQRIRGGEHPVGNLHLSVVAAVGALPELRDYEEIELTQLIAQVCSDYAGVRRKLVSGRDALMRRDKGVYAFEPLGAAVWRVERFIRDNFLALERC